MAVLPACRHKGVLQVWVMQAKDLHKQDVTGKADPFVELSTRVQQVEKTVSHQSRAVEAQCLPFSPVECTLESCSQQAWQQGET